MFYLNEELSTPTRYDMIKFFNFDKDNIDCLTSFYATYLTKLQYVGEYTVIKEVKRPDLLSYNLYGSTQYWWILMWYNSLLNIDDLSSGLVIRYPSHSAIEDLYVQASTFKKAGSK